MKVMLKFTFPTLFLQGFFAVYREVFETLTEEDRDFHDDPKDGNYPQFGDSNSDPEEVKSLNGVIS